MGASASHSGHHATDSASPAACSGAGANQTVGAQGEQHTQAPYIVDKWRKPHHFAEVIEKIKNHQSVVVVSNGDDVDACIAAHALVDGVRRANKIQQNGHIVDYAVSSKADISPDTLIVVFEDKATTAAQSNPAHPSNPTILVKNSGVSHNISTFVRVLANSYTQTKKIDVVQTEWAMWNRVWGYLLSPAFDRAGLTEGIIQGIEGRKFRSSAYDTDPTMCNFLCPKLDELSRYHDCIDYADFDIVHATELHEAAKSYMAWVVDQEHIDRVGSVVTGTDGLRVTDVGTTHGRYLNRIGLAEELRVIQHENNSNHVVYASFGGATKWMDTTAVSIRWCKAIHDKIVETVEARSSDGDTNISVAGIVVVCIWDGDGFDDSDRSAKTGSFTDAIWKTMGRLVVQHKIKSFEMVSSSFANTQHGDAHNTEPRSRDIYDLVDAAAQSNDAIRHVREICHDIGSRARDTNPNKTKLSDDPSMIKMVDHIEEILEQIEQSGVRTARTQSARRGLTNIMTILETNGLENMAIEVMSRMPHPVPRINWHTVTDDQNDDQTDGHNGTIGRRAFCAMLESPACAVLKASCGQLFGPTCFKWQCPTDHKAMRRYVAEYQKAVNSDEFDWDNCKCPAFDDIMSHVSGLKYPKLGTMEEQRMWRDAYVQTVKAAAENADHDASDYKPFWRNCGHATSIHEVTDWKQRCCTLFGYLCLGAYNRAVQSTHVQRSRELLHGAVITDVGRLFSEDKGGVAAETAEYMKNSTTWLSRKGQFEYLPPSERIQSLVLKLPARTTCLEMMAKELFDEDITNQTDLLGERMLSEALDRSDEKRNQVIVDKLEERKMIGVANNSRTVILMRGVQGSGKSTLVNAIQQRHGKDDTVVCSADDFFTTARAYVYDSAKVEMAHEECKQAMTTAMVAQKSLIIVDNTHANIVDVAKYMNRVDEAGTSQVGVDRGASLYRQILADAYARRNKHGVAFTGILGGMNQIDVTNSIEPDELFTLLSKNTSFKSVNVEELADLIHALLQGRISRDFDREVVNQLYDMKELAKSRMETTMQRLLH
jgi:hypothetical protein